jgi:hypothetical protein
MQSATLNVRIAVILRTQSASWKDPRLAIQHDPDAALYRRDRAAFFAGFFAAFFATVFLAGVFLAADFFAAFFVDVVRAAVFTAFFASFLAGDFFKASATEPIAVFTVPAMSSAIARPYPTFSAAFSTNVLFATFEPPVFNFVRSHEL